MRKATVNTVKPLNNGHLRVLKSLSVIKRCPLMGGSLTKIVTFGTKHFVHYLKACPLFGMSVMRGFTVLSHLSEAACFRYDIGKS